jgi:hypothetical protein
MAVQYANGQIVTNGLVLALDAADRNCFPDGEPTTNLFPSPINLGSNRVNAAQIGAVFTDFSTGSFNNGAFVRLTRNVNSTPTSSIAWDFEYSNTNTGYPNGTKFVFSFYARSVDGSTATIRMSNPDAESQSFNLTTQWQRFVGIFTLGAQLSGNLYVRINRSNQVFTSGSSYDISNAQIEFKDYATPFVSGSRNTWNDMSGNGRSGTLSGSVLPVYSNINGGSIVFNGTSSYVFTNNPLPPSASFTLSTWLMYSIPVSDNFRDVINTRESGSNIGFLLTTDIS